MKNKKDLIYIIIIVICALIIVGESIYIFKDKTPIFKDSTKEKIIYTGRRYLKENIVYDIPKDFKLETEIYHEDSLMLIKLTSLEKQIVNSKIIIKYYDEKENLVKTDESTIGILGVNEPYVCNSALPLMEDNVYAGKIVISLEKNYIKSNADLFDKSLLKFTYTTDVNSENSITNITLTADNPYENVNYYDGYVIAYKNNVIKEVGYISIENGKIENGKITNNVYLNPTAISGGIKPLEFDNLEIIINTIY